jgi:hypothetical protein
MAFQKLLNFTKTVSDLADKPALTPTALKAQFDSSPNELKDAFNALIDALKLTTSGDSGAKNIGTTTISGLTGNDVQTLLGAINTNAGVDSTSSNSNGNFIRYNNGIQICWLDKTRTDIGCNNVYGSLFQGTFQWIYPMAFVSDPVVTIGQCKWGNSASWGSVDSVGTTDCLLRIIDVSSRLSGTATVIKAMAIGKWK